MLSVTLAGRHLNVYSSGWSKVESAMRSTSKQCSVENLNVSGNCKFRCDSITVSISIWQFRCECIAVLQIVECCNVN